MIAAISAAILIGYLPGALLYRLPLWQRDRRAALDLEERAFWHVVLSVSWTLTIVLALAALGQYSFDRLLWINGGLVAVILVSARRQLLYGGTADAPRWTLVLPLLLLALAGWRFFPVSEYVIGGKDPGVYVNEGIQIAQRGTLTIHDDAIEQVPAFARDLFFPSEHKAEYYSAGFMGFFIQDPAAGRVVGQFPHLFPASIAVTYGANGLTGARRTVAWWGLLGVLAVYFLAARLFGRGVAFAAASLLTLHIIQVWFARYPNSDIVMQAGLFAGLLAVARAHEQEEGDGWFGWVAAWILGLQLFNRVEALLVVAVCVATVLLQWALTPGARLRWRFLLPMALATGLGLSYLTGLMRAYFWRAAVFLENLPPLAVAGAVVIGVIGLIAARVARRDYGEALRRWVPSIVAFVLVGLALYAFFLREPGGKLVPPDAYALRDFVTIYLGGAMFVLALVGLAVDMRREFWRHPAFFLTFAAVSVFILYKLKIVPEHLWLSRRFLAIILPGSLILGCAAAFARESTTRPTLRLLHRMAGAALLVFTATQYATAAAPVLPHVEYRNIIPYVETLADGFGARDLVILESRDTGSDIHVLGPPLAYTYARSVLVLNSAGPDRIIFREFLIDALTRYERVFFVGTGGTTLLSRQIVATPVSSDRVQIDEFEVTTDRLPSAVRRKEFDYGVYALTLGGTEAGPFLLDLGERDDLHVRRFHAKERSADRTIRWTQDASDVAISGMTGAEREVTLTMSHGGRPAAAAPARVEVYFNGALIGTVTVEAAFTDYRFALPAPLAAAAAQSDEPATLRLVSSVWSPRALLGVADDRALGVMVDRLAVR